MRKFKVFFINFATRGKNNIIHCVYLSLNLIVCFPKVQLQLSSANLLYPVFQMFGKGSNMFSCGKQRSKEIHIFVDLTRNPSLDCLTMDVECRAFFSDAETVHSSSVLP